MWKIQYNQRFPEWHPQSNPCIVNEKGQMIVFMQKFVDHPGMLDTKANEIAKIIVNAVNKELFNDK